METHEPAIALTFDDGPHPKYTPIILDILSERKQHATFFVVGDQANRHPHIIKRIVAEGHGLGTHTRAHTDLSKLKVCEALKECRQSRRNLEQISCSTVRLLRPPWGRLRLSTFLAARLSGLRMAFWNVDSLDHLGLSPSDMISRLANFRLSQGDIVLFHDDGINTVQLLPELLRQLEDRCLNCIPLDPVEPRQNKIN